MTKRTEYKKIDSVKGQIIESEKGNILKIVEEENFYTFRNTLNGPYYFEREDKEVGIIEGKQICDDITEKERKKILKGGAFKLGYIVEDTSDLAEGFLPDSIGEKQIKKLMRKHKKDSDFWKDHIGNMDSPYALERLREQFTTAEFPSSLISVCDTRLAEIHEQAIEDQREPSYGETAPQGI